MASLVRASKRLLAVLAVGAAACSGHADCPQPAVIALAHEQLGEPCGVNQHCAAPLSCRTIYPVIDATTSFGANACTVACEGAGVCPAGGVCATVGTLKTCLPSCASDADCSKGTSGGACVSDGPDAGHCERTSCTGDAQCSGGFTCQIPGVLCCPPGGKCPFTGPIPGYCRNPAADAGA